MSSAPLYDTIGATYTATRHTKPRIAAQRSPGAAPCVAGSAEHLPFGNLACDAAMAVCTIHHWPDPAELGARLLVA